MNEFASRRIWGTNVRIDRVLAYEPPRRDFIKIAGPCSVESVEQIKRLANAVAACGATHLRGGLFRAGTYPGENFGWVDPKLIAAAYDAAKWNGLQNIVEILDYTPESMAQILPYAECVQVGARQVQNYRLLQILGNTGKTVFLKNGLGTKIDEWLGAAEYILKAGGHPVLIERGGATYHQHVRWDLCVSIIPAIKSMSKIPIIIDASHGTGRRDLVAPMTLAGVAAGADGCLVEVHEEPTQSLSDPDQAITPQDYKDLCAKINNVRGAIQ